MQKKFFLSGTVISCEVALKARAAAKRENTIFFMSQRSGRFAAGIMTGVSGLTDITQR